MLTLPEARDRIHRFGDYYGDVCAELPEADRPALAEWFVRTPGLPNTIARAARAPSLSGNACPRCGGVMVRTGSCETCQSCGESSGGCG
jgi:hypothetical protein